jgi:hypothetical protein
MRTRLVLTVISVACRHRWKLYRLYVETTVFSETRAQTATITGRVGLDQGAGVELDE